MAQSRIAGDLVVSGSIVAGGTVHLADGQVADDQVAAGAEIAATKLEHQHALSATISGTVAAATIPIHLCRAAVEIVDVQVVALTAPTGGDKAFTVDVKKGNQSTALASVLSAVITVNSTVADREVKTGTVTTTAAAADDVLVVVVATSGSTGTQASNVVVVVTIRELPA